jgi:hypothetical protein
MTPFRKLGDSAMKLDWKAQPVLGESMFNLELGTSYADVVNLLKGRETSNGIIQIENSSPMRLVISTNEESIRFKKMEDENYDWQSYVALLYFQNGILNSITTYLNEPHSYRGLICGKIGLGEEIRALDQYFTLEYDDIDECIYALEEGKLNGLELLGTSCDLSVDPMQKIGGMKVFVID